ncbi:unnamed protein product [Rhodiola kirilowii]
MEVSRISSGATMGLLTQLVVMETARSLAVLLMVAGTILNGLGTTLNLSPINKRFPLDQLHKKQTPGPENKDASDTEDDEEEDADEVDDHEEDDDDEDFTGEGDEGEGILRMNRRPMGKEKGMMMTKMKVKVKMMMMMMMMMTMMMVMRARMKMKKRRMKKKMSLSLRPRRGNRCNRYFVSLE